MSFEQSIVSAAPPELRRCASATLLFALGALVFNLGRLIADGYAAINFPWELDYGEGIVWEQMRLMLEGRGYGAIDGFPAIVFHYPPLFHMLTAALASTTGMDGLAAGRTLALSSTLGLGLFAGLIAWKVVCEEAPRLVALICGTVAGLAVFSFWPIMFWAPLMRVDMTATLLSFAGVFTAMLSLKRPFLILAAAASFVAAVYTKQTMIAAPAAVFLTFLLLRPKLAWGFAAACSLLGLVVLATLAWSTDGGFLRHIFLYNVNRFDASRLVLVQNLILAHAFHFAVLAIGLRAYLSRELPASRGGGGLVALRARLAAAPGHTGFLLVSVYAVLSGLMTLTVAKSGSNVNYLVEWMAILAVLLGIVVRDAAAAVAGVASTASKRSVVSLLLLPSMIGFQALILTFSPSYADHRAEWRAGELQALRDMIRSADRPVISDDMVLLVRAGVPVQWEPAIFAELASTGMWNESPFVQRIRAGEFAFFITVGKQGNGLFDSRYNPAVAEAINTAYPIQQQAAGYTLHLPRERQ